MARATLVRYVPAVTDPAEATLVAPVSAEGDDSGLAAFYRAMTVPERRTMLACALGYALDGLDFTIYTLVLGSVIALWHVDRGSAGLTVSATLLCSAVGGWIAGYISDRAGRVRAVQITVLWFALFSLLSAFAQSFAQLAVFRALLGFGFGGEWTAAAALMSETIRPRYRGRAVGCVQSGWAVGWGSAVLLQAVVYTLVPEQQAWRWMFALGFIPALYVLFVRRFVEEPPLAAAARRDRVATGSMWEIFSPGLIKTTALAALLGTGAQGGYYAVNTWLPVFLQTERHLTIVGSTSYLAFLITGAFAGYLTGAWLADRVGRRMLFLMFSAGALVMTLIYTRAPVSTTCSGCLAFRSASWRRAISRGSARSSRSSFRRACAARPWDSRTTSGAASVRHSPRWSATSRRRCLYRAP
jgi:MFS family permease